MEEKISQSERLYRLILDGQWHSTREILKIVYGDEHMGLARVGGRIYDVWDRYGGRGIKCLWESFEEFRDDMYESYLQLVKDFGEKQTTIDRKDGAGNYCRDNCRWATIKEQNNNKRNNTVIKFNGKSQNLGQWAADIGVCPETLLYRLKKWSKDRALTELKHKQYGPRH